jgi:hypothetical protein
MGDVIGWVKVKFQIDACLRHETERKVRLPFTLGIVTRTKLHDYGTVVIDGEFHTGLLWLFVDRGEDQLMRINPVRRKLVQVQAID